MSLISKLRQWASHKPSAADVWILIGGMLIITWQPFYLYGKINIFEMGLYLPGIDAILNGAIPYRDFFHLRGPLELYLPAWMMEIVGRHFYIMPSYFYLGTIATLIAVILIAKELFQSRFFLYVMSLALIARAFPRVSFAIGGGFRFAWGLAGVYCLIQFFKKGNKQWLYGAGIFAAMALMTSIDVGFCIIVSGFTTLMLHSFYVNKKLDLGNVIAFSAGMGIIIIPLVLYLHLNQAFIPMVESYYQVMFNMVKTFPQTEVVPRNIIEVIVAMLNPSHVNFKHMTPLYCYVLIACLLWKWSKDKIYRADVAVLALYGLILFVLSMRSLWGPGFETAIQSEKILYFLLLERLFFVFSEKSNQFQKNIALVFVIMIFITTLSYALPRFQKRFIAMQMMWGGEKKLMKTFPFNSKDLVVVDLPVMKGMAAPQDQVKDIMQLDRFFKINADSTSKIMFFPDAAGYYFILNRPFVGRFPVVSLSWISEKWHDEFMRHLITNPPDFVVTNKDDPDYIDATTESNKQKIAQMQQFIHDNYHPASSTVTMNIWEHNLR